MREKAIKPQNEEIQELKTGYKTKRISHEHFDYSWSISFFNPQEFRSLLYQIWAAVLIERKELKNLPECILQDAFQGDNHIARLPAEYHIKLREFTEYLFFKIKKVNGSSNKLLKFLHQWHGNLKSDINQAFSYNYNLENDDDRRVIIQIITANKIAKNIRNALGLSNDQDRKTTLEIFENKPKKIQKNPKKKTAQEIFIDALYENVCGNDAHALKLFEEAYKEGYQEETKSPEKLPKTTTKKDGFADIYGKEFFISKFWAFDKKKEFQSAFRILNHQLLSQDPKSILMLGTYYYLGKGVEERSYEKAVRYFTKAADLEDIFAQYNLGICYTSGIGVKKDVSKAASYLKKSADQGFKVAQHELANFYQKGYGVKKNYKKAVKYFTKAANQNYAPSQYHLGDCLQYGEGVRQDLKQAFYWYEKAALQNHAMAQYSLANCYMNGSGVEADEKIAVHYLSQAANQGIKEAQHNLALCYMIGRGVEQDQEKAISDFENLAQSGYALSQKFLVKHFSTKLSKEKHEPEKNKLAVALLYWISKYDMKDIQAEFFTTFTSKGSIDNFKKSIQDVKKNEKNLHTLFKIKDEKIEGSGLKSFIQNFNKCKDNLRDISENVKLIRDMIEDVERVITIKQKVTTPSNQINPKNLSSLKGDAKIREQ